MELVKDVGGRPQKSLSEQQVQEVKTLACTFQCGETWPLGRVLSSQKSTSSDSGLFGKKPSGGGSSGDPLFMNSE